MSTGDRQTEVPDRQGKDFVVCVILIGRTFFLRLLRTTALLLASRVSRWTKRRNLRSITRVRKFTAWFLPPMIKGAKPMMFIYLFIWFVFSVVSFEGWIKKQADKRLAFLITEYGTIRFGKLYHDPSQFFNSQNRQKTKIFEIPFCSNSQ